MITYEYKHFNKRLDERELNRLGAKGWKLISHTAVAVSGGVMSSGDFGQYYIFMREIQPDE
jgi:hypothetical protein